MADNIPAPATPTSGIIGGIIALISQIFEYLTSNRRRVSITKQKLEEAQAKLTELDNEIKLKAAQYQDIGELMVKRKELVDAINSLQAELGKKGK